MVPSSSSLPGPHGLCGVRAAVQMACLRHQGQRPQQLHRSQRLQLPQLLRELEGRRQRRRWKR